MVAIVMMVVQTERSAKNKGNSERNTLRIIVHIHLALHTFTSKRKRFIAECEELYFTHDMIWRFRSFLLLFISHVLHEQWQSAFVSISTWKFPLWFLLLAALYSPTIFRTYRSHIEFAWYVWRISNPPSTLKVYADACWETLLRTHDNVIKRLSRSISLFI